MNERSPATAAKLPTAKDIQQINAAHQATVMAYQGALEKAIECGVMLVEAKRKVGHGAWESWLGDNCPDISLSTAKRYMRYARNAPELEEAAEQNGQALADLSGAAAGKILAKPQTPEEKEKRKANKPCKAPLLTMVSPIEARRTCILHLKALSGADEVLDLLKQVYDKEFLTKLDDLIAGYCAAGPDAPATAPMMQ